MKIPASRICWPALLFVCVGAASGGLAASDKDAPSAADGYRTRTLNGWTAHVSEALLRDDKEATRRALKLMRGQLRTIVRRVPAPALEILRGVPLWISSKYEDAPARAEYHPGEAWLREHGRNPDMVKGVEFTNVAIFEKECARMPLLVLHELAHAYHDQVFGFDDAAIKAAWQKAKDSGKYDNVQNHAGKLMRAYALTNPQEYFAESTEAYFGKNDFFPFDAVQLKVFDPDMYALLERKWSPP